MAESASSSSPTQGTPPTATESTLARPAQDAASLPLLAGLGKWTNESLGLLATLGFFTALLYLFGRAYSSALLMALKLPEILVPLPINQYYELGAVPLFFFALVLATTLAYGLGIRFLWSNACFYVIALIVDGVLTLLTWPLRVRWRWLPKRLLPGWLRLPGWLHLPAWRVPMPINQWLQSRLPRYQRWFPITDAESRRLERLSQYSNAVVMLIIGMIVIGGLFFWMLGQSALLGRSATTQIVVHPARLFLAQPLSARPTTSTTLTTGATGYVYDKAFLIARGDERYFVFDALDPATCTPKEVLQVPASSVVDVVYGTPIRLGQLCQLMFPQPTLTPTSPPAPSPAPSPVLVTPTP